MWTSCIRYWLMRSSCLGANLPTWTTSVDDCGKNGNGKQYTFFFLKWRLRSCRKNTQSWFTIQVLTLSCCISDYTDVEFVTSVSLSITLMTFCLVTVDRTCTLIRTFYLTLHKKRLFSSVSLSDVMMCWYSETYHLFCSVAHVDI